MELLQSIKEEYIARQKQIFFEINTYLDTPVGVGEHPDIVEAVKQKLKEYDELQSLIDSCQNVMQSKSKLQSL